MTHNKKKIIRILPINFCKYSVNKVHAFNISTYRDTFGLTRRHTG